MSLQPLTSTLCPTGPFDFSHALRFLAKFRPMMGQQTIEDAGLTKAFYVGRQVVLFNVKSTGTPDQPLRSAHRRRARPGGPPADPARRDRLELHAAHV